MYISTVLVHVQSLLVQNLAGVIDPQSIQITPDEKPWATSGEMTITIHPTGWDTGEVKKDHLVHGERVPFAVTVIQRTRKSPHDRLGFDLFLNGLDSLTSISSIISKIINKRSSSNNTLTTEYTTRINKLTNTTLKNILLPNGKSSNVIGMYEWLDTQSQPVPRMPEFFRETPRVSLMEESQVAGHSITGFYLSPTLLQAITCPS